MIEPVWEAMGCEVEIPSTLLPPALAEPLAGDERRLVQRLPSMAVALGLALQGLGRVGGAIDLIPESRRRSRADLASAGNEPRRATGGTPSISASEPADDGSGDFFAGLMGAMGKELMGAVGVELFEAARKAQHAFLAADGQGDHEGTGSPAHRAMAIKTLTVAIESGLTCLQALAIARDLGDPVLTPWAQRAIDCYEQGGTVTESMALEPYPFDRRLAALTAAGEANGRLHDALSHRPDS